MAGTRTDNTFAESLTKVLRSLADMKVLPDADLEFILNMEMQVVQKLREPIDTMQTQGSTQVPGAPGMGMPMGPQMGPPPGMGGGLPPELMGMPPEMGMPGMGGGGGVPGMRQEPAMPNPDELRRILQG
jgi:hypothetical protein